MESTDADRITTAKMATQEALSACTMTFDGTTTGYDDFASAWNAATGAATDAENKATITLNEDISTTASFSNTEDYLILDTNGHTLNFGSFSGEGRIVNNGGSLDVIGSGKLTGSSTRHYGIGVLIVNNGIVKVTDATIENQGWEGSVAVIVNNGEFHFLSGKLVSGEEYAILSYNGSTYLYSGIIQSNGRYNLPNGGIIMPSEVPLILINQKNSVSVAQIAPAYSLDFSNVAITELKYGANADGSDITTKEDNIYDATVNASKYVTITKTEKQNPTPTASDFTFTPPESLVYSGSEKTATVTAASGISGMGAITVEYYSGDTKLDAAPTDIGEYTVKVNVDAGDSYAAATAIADSNWTYTVTAKELTVNVAVQNKHYDGLNNAQFDGTPSLVGVVEGDEVNLTNGTPTFDSIDVANDIAISITDFTISGKDSANYTVKQPTGIMANIIENEKDKLTSITAPTSIIVANGTDYSAMNLPATVGIVTEGNTVTTATVNWDTTTPASGSYDPSVLTEQTVTLNGTVTCPSEIDANGVSLTTTIVVTISAAGITDPTPDPAPTPTPDPTPTYKIINGANGIWTMGLDGTLVIKGDGAYSKFKAVKVDGTVVSASNYSVTEGSTIITFKADYLKTLSVGNHTFELVWTDASASTSFTIKEEATNTPSQKDDVPKTGDTTPIVWLFILAVISGTGILYFGRKRKTVR